MIVKHDETIKLLAHPVREFVCPGCGFNIDVSGKEMLAPVTCPKCGKELTVPARIGDFILVQILGSGGMATVYRAYDSALNRYVAIKVMRRVYGEDPKFAERFLREARAAARLNHPNVVQIYSCSEEKGQPYIVMELVAGEELDQKIKRDGALPEKRVLQIALDIAKGLSAAADIGLVHGDIKPANIIFDKNDNAKVADFGLARFTRQEEETDGEIWGTPYYIAPEKARKQKEDQRSDIYCLGATLYHALTGVPPFDGETATDVVLARLTETPVDVRQLRPEISDQTAAVIMRMIEEDRMRRYPNYVSLIRDLEETLQKLAQGKTTHSFAAHQEKGRVHAKRKRLPVTWLVAGAVLVVLLGWVGFQVASLLRSQTPVEVGTGDVTSLFSAERDRELSLILQNMTPENAAASRQLLGSVLSVNEPLHEGRYWIRLFRMTAFVLERELEAAHREAGILLRPPSTAPSVRSAPEVWPGELARLLLGEGVDTDLVLVLEGDPGWYPALDDFYRGLRRLLDGDLQGAARALERYAQNERKSVGDPEWPYALQNLSKELYRRVMAWIRLSEEVERLLAQDQVAEVKARLEPVQSRLFVPFKAPFEERIREIEARQEVEAAAAREREAEERAAERRRQLEEARLRRAQGELLISVNFTARDTATRPLQPEDVVGVVPLPNWNNVHMDAGTQTHQVQEGGLIDSLGDAVADVSVYGSGVTNSWNIDSEPAINMLSDFMSSVALEAESDPILRVTGLTSRYDLILYPQAFGTDNNVDITVTTQDERGSVIASETRMWENRSTPDAVQNNEGWVENDNYQQWSDLTGSSVEVALRGASIGLSGFQIIAEAVTPPDAQPGGEPGPVTEAVRLDLARISAWQEEQLAQLARTMDFIEAQRALRILRTSMQTADGRTAYAVEEDRVRRMQDLLNFLVESVNDRPYADAQARLGGETVRATQRGITILLGDGSGQAERTWSTIGLRDIALMTRYYVTQLRLRPDQEAEIMLALALHYHAAGQVDIARSLAQGAVSLHEELEPAVRRLIP